MTITPTALTPDTITGSDRSGTEPDQPQTFEELLRPTDGAPGEVPPVLTGQVVVASNGQYLVLIGQAADAGGRDSVEVVNESGVLTTRDRQATATPVSDPGRRENVLRLTLSRLAARYRDAREVERQGAAQAIAQTRVQANLLSQIRDYAVERHEGGDISREVLDDFLEEFDLPPYRPSVRVEYTITGSYSVINSTTDEASSDAEGYLRPDLSQLDRVADDSDTYTVSVDGVEEDS